MGWGAVGGRCESWEELIGNDEKRLDKSHIE